MPGFLRFVSLALARQTPDELAEEVRLAKEEVCSTWPATEWSAAWRSAGTEARRLRLVDALPLMPTTRTNPQTVSGEDAQGFADLWPELNLEELSMDDVLLHLVDLRCSKDIADQRRLQDADLALARKLARSGKIGRRSSSVKLFYLRDPLTTEVTGPLKGEGSSGNGGSEGEWSSKDSDLVIESEIWWTVLVRQQSMFTSLSSILKEQPGKADEDDSDSLIPVDLAFWCCGLLMASLFWAFSRLLRRLCPSRVEPPPDLCCPMSLELFKDPVVAADGETYERWWIEKWIQDKTDALPGRPRHGTGVLSPMGHGMLKHAKLVSNQTVRRLANQWREKHQRSD